MNGAILLVGPTGSGKTPLGELLQERGLWGKRCFHFDLGRLMREAVAGGCSGSPLSRAEIGFLAGVLRSGALLEDEHFHIAEKLLTSFIAERRITGEDIIVLNGLPRHVGQAEGIAPFVDLRVVVSLECDAEAVLERIGTNVGGDRAERVDDDVEAVREKLKTFHARTLPLIEHYETAGAAVVRIDVEARTTAEQMRDALCQL